MKALVDHVSIVDVFKKLKNLKKKKPKIQTQTYIDSNPNFTAH